MSRITSTEPIVQKRRKKKAEEQSTSPTATGVRTDDVIKGGAMSNKILQELGRLILPTRDNQLIGRIVLMNDQKFQFIAVEVCTESNSKLDKEKWFKDLRKKVEKLNTSIQRGMAIADEYGVCHILRSEGSEPAPEITEKIAALEDVLRDFSYGRAKIEPNSKK